MDKQKLIMWAAVIGGGYLIYLYLKDQGILDKLFPSVEPAPSDPAKTNPALATHTTGAVVTPTPTPPVTTPTATKVIPVTPAEQLIYAAAAGDMGKALALNALGVKFTADEWNWYRANATSQSTDVDLFPPDNRGYRMTASEYLQARAAHGLGGTGMGYYANAFDDASAWVV